MTRIQILLRAGRSESDHQAKLAVRPRPVIRPDRGSVLFFKIGGSGPARTSIEAKYGMTRTGQLKHIKLIKTYYIN